uniref:P2X purinoreceptor 7 intracellular domain-containing protein n=1 Tax=Xenopus tropicalis TaxID=8364 RepID=A0A803JSY4_XENTR
MVKSEMAKNEEGEEHKSGEDQSETEENEAKGTAATGSLLNEPTRVGNSDWCQCGLCIPMPTGVESICCYEIPKIFEKIPEDAFCIIDNPDFETEVLDHQRLDWGLRMSNFKITKQPRCDAYMRSMRKIAYRAFTVWIYTFLGFCNRKPIPSCVVREIRSKFPDPKGKYTGFLSARDYFAEDMAYDTD